MDAVSEASSEPAPEPAPEDLDWSPVRSGGAIFGTHRARFTPDRVEFSPTRGTYVLVGVIASAGALTLIGSVAFYVLEQDPGALIVGILMLVTSLVLVIGLRKLLFNHRIFDRSRGLYWDTREGGDRQQPGPKAQPLTNVRAIQITREHVAGGDANFDSDELNLVLVESRGRINVVDHGDALGQRHDAEQLAAWLALPLWISRQVSDASTDRAEGERPR